MTKKTIEKELNLLFGFQSPKQLARSRERLERLIMSGSSPFMVGQNNLKLFLKKFERG
jgi:hypothetical protein